MTKHRSKTGTSPMATNAESLKFVDWEGWRPEWIPTKTTKKCLHKGNILLLWRWTEQVVLLNLTMEIVYFERNRVQTENVFDIEIRNVKEGLQTNMVIELMWWLNRGSIYAFWVRAIKGQRDNSESKRWLRQWLSRRDTRSNDVRPLKPFMMLRIETSWMSP